MARGGKRAGAGRPSYADMDGYMQAQRATQKTVTLRQEEWDWLQEHSDDGKVSSAIRGLMYFMKNRPPNGEPIPGFKFSW